MAEVIATEGAHVGSQPAQAEIAIEYVIEYIRVAGVDAGGIIGIIAVGGHEMEIGVSRIAEERIDVDVALALVAALHITIGDDRRRIKIITYLIKAQIGMVMPEDRIFDNRIGVVTINRASIFLRYVLTYAII